jgi:hypothetical protein
MTLRETQQRMATALMTPLRGGEEIAQRTRLGVSIAKEAAEIIKPNERLTSLERLEIYSRSYWFRLLDSIRDDYPGLRAILGSERFDGLATAYLADCPSESFTLRDLGSRMEAWLESHPRYTGPNRRLVLDMARLEWAHIVAFDGPEEKMLGPEDFAELAPNLRVGIQPNITLLELQYAVDVMRVVLKTAPDYGASTSNVAIKRRQHATGKFRHVTPEHVFLAVHRVDTSVYYRRLGPEEYRLLTALRSGRTIVGAIRHVFRESQTPSDQVPEMLRSWFGAWAELGWLTARQKSKRGRL